jgi:hypothetical protein
MKAAYDSSVFLNCPFDPTYRPLFEAVIFGVYDCGFFPRCALESDDSSEVRLNKITTLIGSCRLAIHDISRTQLDSRGRLPRFNMPFEFGVFMGAKAFGSDQHHRKACVVLDSEGSRYRRFFSDIAGQDIRSHGSDAERAIHEVRDFLSAHCPPHLILPGGRMLAERYRAFCRDLPESCAELHLDPANLTFRDLTVLIVGWLRLHPLPHHASART